MSTAAVSFSAPAPSLPGRRYDRVFFAVLSVLMLGTVLLGFARTYFLAGMVRAHLPSWIIHVHGALFSSWILLFVVQSTLITAGKPRVHMKLGLFGFGLACVMVVFGLLAATNSLHRNFVPPGAPFTSPTFYVVPLTDMLMFATFVTLGYRLRRNPAAHKRVMILSTVSLLDAAIARWPFAFVANHWLADLTCYSFIFAMVLYDLWSTHKVQKATWAGGLFVIVLEQLRIPLAMTPLWQGFAHFMQTHFV